MSGTLGAVLDKHLHQRIGREVLTRADMVRLGCGFPDDHKGKPVVRRASEKARNLKPVSVRGYRLTGFYSSVRLAEVVEALDSGLSDAEVARDCRTTEYTVSLVRRQMEAQGAELTCGCGRPSNHHGYCMSRKARAR